MAAIVCRMIDKEEDAEKAKGGTAFDDVSSDHWASGYINIASKEGIINGDGNGKFRPEDDVKHEEAIKMVVCALGYGNDVEIDEKDWSKGYLEVADKKGISADLKGTKGKASTRGDVAVMSYNGLSVDLVAPTASLKAGNYTGTKSVKLETTTEGAEIYYTTDGSIPTVKSTKYKILASFKKINSLIKDVVAKVKDSMFTKKIPRKQKNYMYLSHDEVKIQKMYYPDYKFYIQLLFVPSICTIVILLILHILKLLTSEITTTITGLIGGYIASVIVSLLIDAKDCDVKSLTRLRFQQVYFEDIYNLCEKYIYFNVSYMCNNFKEETFGALENGKNNTENFIGFPWQHWCSLLNELIDSSETQCLPQKENIDDTHAKEFYSQYIKYNNFENKILDIVNSYKNSIDSVFVNDYIYNFQRLLIMDIIIAFNELLKCIAQKDYSNFWNKNDLILRTVVLLSENIYAFKTLREDEHIYSITPLSSGEVRSYFEELEENVFSDGYTRIKRKEYKKLKKIKRIVDRFEEDNSKRIDNGWFD